MADGLWQGMDVDREAADFPLPFKGAGSVVMAIFVKELRVSPRYWGTKTEQTTIMELTSPAFRAKQEIPVEHTFDGENKSPPLEISGVPPEAKSLALLMEDLDSPIGPFTHWVVWNIPPDTRELVAGRMPIDIQIGINGFGEVRYGGPCPPSGKHRYRFTLFALGSELESTTPDRFDQIKDEMRGDVLGRATLVGVYAAAS